MDKAAEAARLKVPATLPGMQRRDANLAHCDIYIDISGGNGRDERIAYLPVLQEA